MNAQMDASVIENLKSKAMMGTLKGTSIRSLFWKIFLGVVQPLDSHDDCIALCIYIFAYIWAHP